MMQVILRGLGRRCAARRGVLAIVWAALIVRLAFVWETSQVPTVRHLVGDAAEYFAWAQRIAGGDWLGSEGFYQAPLYPYVLAVGFTAFGESVWTIRLLQAVWGALACGFVCVGAGRLFGRRVGITAGWMLAMYAPAVYFDGIVQKASLTGLLVCALVAAIAWTARTPAWYALTATGLLAGLLSITRENAMVWIAVLAVWAWRLPNANCQLPIATRRHVAPTTATCVLILGAALVLFPVALRNRWVSGEWSVSTFQAGPNFYIGNHRGADGRYRPLVRGHETPAFERRDATALAQQATGRPLSQREVSRYWMGKAWAEIRGDWAGWLKLMGRKVLIVINRYEIADAESYYVYRESSMVLWALGGVWHFGVLLPLAAIGLMATWSERRRLWVLQGMMATMAAAVASFYVLARYRYPIALLLVPFAAAGVVHLWDAWKRRDYVRCGAPALVALLAGILVNVSVQDERRLDAMAWMNVGVALAESGDLPGAESYFQRAVADQPSSAEAHNNLAQALALRGAFAEAVEHYGAALSIEPNLIGAHYNLGVALEQIGRREEAQGAFARALQLDPSDKQARDAATRLRDRQ